MTKSDLSSIEAVSFDCYGTLVDWETGIVTALRQVLEPHGAAPGDDRLLEMFARHESAVEAGPYRPYREVLRRVTRRIAEECGVEADDRELGVLPRSLPDWPVFADTVPTLTRLGERFRLGILSNVDDDLFAATAVGLGVDFDWVVTAEQVGSYKPASRNFEALLERTGLPPDSLLHAAQSAFHDIVPAAELGLRTAWVRRRGRGATPPAKGRAEIQVADLEGLGIALLG